MTPSRRDLLIGTATVAVGGASAPLLGSLPAFAQAAEPQYKPEQGASLRVLRWAPFVKGDEDQWIANTQKFTQATGVDVRIDKESWEDIRPKAAVAANVGSGPDIMLVWFDDPHQYPEKLLPVTDLANYLGNKYGGWYDGLQGYAKRGDQFVALPLAAIGNGIIYRDSMLKAAGFQEMPKDTAGFLELAKALKAKAKPMGFALGKAVGDGNNFAHWIVWSHGGKMVDENGKVVINSPETIKALQYARELYQQFIPGTEAWLDINNNRAFLAGDVGLTANGVSLYYSAKTDPKLAEMAADMRSANMPIGPIGRPMELHQTTSSVIFQHTKFPQAAKAYLKFMYEQPQMSEWLKASSAYCCQPLKAYADNPVWTSDPLHAPYAKASETLVPNGYAGPLGYASAATMADYVMVDMVAEAASGQRSPEEAAKRAETRANRYYRL
jgi:multiple sugar transport system substrate-binding protein